VDAIIRYFNIHSFRICIWHPFKKPTRSALGPATVIKMSYEACSFKEDTVPGQQAQCKRESIPGGGANNRESLTLSPQNCCSLAANYLYS